MLITSTTSPVKVRSLSFNFDVRRTWLGKLLHYTTVHKKYPKSKLTHTIFFPYMTVRAGQHWETAGRLTKFTCMNAMRTQYAEVDNLFHNLLALRADTVDF